MTEFTYLSTKVRQQELEMYEKCEQLIYVEKIANQVESEYEKANKDVEYICQQHELIDNELQEIIDKLTEYQSGHIYKSERSIREELSEKMIMINNTLEEVTTMLSKATNTLSRYKDVDQSESERDDENTIQRVLSKFISTILFRVVN